MPKHAGRTALYRLYSKAGELLYIGISHKPDVRWGQHSEEKEWWPAVDRRDVEWHETRASAERAELTAIAAEKPLHNKVGTPAFTVSTVGGKTPTRPIRVGLDMWAAFGAATAEQGSDRSATLRAFMAWYLGLPGAELPERPNGDTE
ncbi:MAG: GIY-YIG nuclease family protein [Streptomyces sp.]|jgi:predicted GIY-YIG superfamily endonuclease|nr:GIY-YIG nuclease family protein [Streptomyces sp.]